MICILNFRRDISKIPDHRRLAINRGEKKRNEGEGRCSCGRDPYGHEGIRHQNEKRFFIALLNDVIEDAYKRLMAPSIEREMRNLLTERAEREAVKVFAKNTEKLLMVPPVKNARIISIDPGYRTGCKVAVLDETGKLKAYTTIYPTEPKNDVAGT